MANEGPLGFFFADAPAGSPLSYEALQTRRRIAEALLGRRRSGFPKNIGEGLTYLGERIADRRALDELDAADKAYFASKAGDTRVPGQSSPSPDDEAPAPIPAIPASLPVSSIPAASVRASAPAPDEAPEPTPDEVPDPAAALRSYGTRSPYAPAVPADMPDTSPNAGGAFGGAFQGARPRSDVGPLQDPRNGVARAILAQRGVIPPDPTLPPGPALAALSGGDTASDAPPIGVPGAQLAQAANPPIVVQAPRSVRNPPTIVRDIQPAPPPGGVPGPMTPPSVLPPDVAVDRGPPRVGPPPEYPKPRSTPTKDEMVGYELKRKYPGDPYEQRRAEDFLKFGAQQRADEYARAVDVYKSKLEEWKKDVEYERNRPRTESELRAADQAYTIKQRDEQEKLARGGMSPAAIDEVLKESRKTVEAVPAALSAFRRVQELLNSDPKMFTGSDAEIRLSMAKVATALGFTPNPRVSATEEFKSVIAPIIAAQRQALVGNANVSDQDRMAAEKAAAGNITLERGSIQRIMNTMETATVGAVLRHNRKMATAAGPDPDRQRIIYGLNEIPMEAVVPPAAIEQLRNGPQTPARYQQFDEHFHYPGLARRLMGGGR